MRRSDSRNRLRDLCDVLAGALDLGYPVTGAWHPPATMGRRAVLRSQGHRGPSDLTAADDKKIAHGICSCGRRTFLYLPARMCERCLNTVNASIMLALQEMEDVE